MITHEHPVLREIYIYPIKSLAGIKVSSWPVTETGLLYDRHWMIVDQNHRFLSQRQIPAMALIHCSIDNENLTLAQYKTNSSIKIPLSAYINSKITTSIWEDECPAYPLNNEVNEWLSDTLHKKCTLVQQTADKRKVDKKYAKPSDHTSFSDGFPFLLLANNSMLKLNELTGLNQSIMRFRPNLVIDQCEAFAEDYWREISIGKIHFRLPKPCSRCSIPGIDPETALSGKEPLKTLAIFRKWNKKIYFGQNALHNGTGQLTIGEAVTITQLGDAQPPIKK